MNESQATPHARSWTPPQRHAIAHLGGDLLVSAAAGSGKTAVLAERCARLVCEGDGETGGGGAGGCGVENLLVLTFTEAAANEMRTRIADAIRQKVRLAPPNRAAWLRRQAAMVDRASIATLHSFCARVLRHHFHEAQIDPNFEVIDQEEAALMREEVLDDLLAHWHKLPDGSAARAFTDFFEAYAQGRDGTCRHTLLTLHDMLASTASREEYLARARHIYSPEGCPETFRDYLAGVCAQVQRLAAAARRACDLVRRVVGPGPMHNYLCQMQQLLESGHRDLCTRGIDAWSDLRTRLSFKWDACSTVAGIDDFEGLKKHTWEAVKSGMQTLCNKTLAPDPHIMRSELATLGAPLETLLGLAETFDAAFSAAKRAQNRVDFNDLERLTLTLLTRPASLAAEELRRRYHFLLVDEVQDINPLQWTLLDAVRSPLRFEGAGNLFMVGDVKQSIYGFRLADPNLFLAREREWRNASTDTPGKYISLPHNFRSQPRLLDTLNRFFERLLTPEVAGIQYTDGHALMPPPPNPPPHPSPPPSPSPQSPPSPNPSRAFDGAPVEFHLVVMDKADDDDDSIDDDSIDRRPPPENLSAIEHEARMVADRIAGLLAEGRSIQLKDGTSRPLARRDIAILLRGMKNKAMLFSRALARRGIPAHADLSTGFFDTPEIRDTLALLQVLDNPRQDIPLATVLLGPYGNFSHDDLATLRLTYDRKEVLFAEAVDRYPRDGALAAPPPTDASPEVESLSNGPQPSTLFPPRTAGIQDYAIDPPPFSEDLASRLRHFFDRLAAWRELLHARPLHEGLADIYAESRILVYVAGMEAGAQRVANLQMLHQRALKFATFRKQGLHRFLRFIDKLREGDGGRGVGGGGGAGGDLGEAPILSEASDVVRIMSIHKSKGLEFPLVFLSGLGSRLLLRQGGPVFIHRDLGVGLDIADIDRNVFYPSAASARIVDAVARSNRAEELRLLYVAMTRARDHLVLTGHINKQVTLDRLRRQWSLHEGPLPEDLLLKANSPLDWLLPAIACGNACSPPPASPLSPALRIAWNTPNPPPDTQLLITLHPPAPTTPETLGASTDDPAQDHRIARILEGKPLTENAPAHTPDVARVLERVTGTYPHAAAAREPAVRTVTFLKTIVETSPDDIQPEFDELAALQLPDDADLAFEAPASPPQTTRTPQPRDPAAADGARLRGIATHRLLERLDLARCTSPQALDAQVQHLLERGALDPDDLERADLPGIHWVLLASQSGRRLVAAASAKHTLQIRRELPFTWAAPLVPGETADPADWPTIRGVIDALVIDPDARTAELFDYKTDAAFLYESRLDDYQRQMRYYLRAASQILGFPVTRATLLFLAARQEHPVTP